MPANGLQQRLYFLFRRDRDTVVVARTGRTRSFSPSRLYKDATKSAAARDGLQFHKQARNSSALFGFRPLPQLA